MRYYVGTSGWHYRHWRQRFYPENLSTNRWLEFYSRHYNTVELNNSFYRLPSENTFATWHDSSPDDFIFAVKVSRFITHIKRLKDVASAVENFIVRARILSGKLGPLLYQLPPGMHRDDDRLEAFLSGLPRGFEHVIEFRHASWLDDAVYSILHKYNSGFCVFDMPDMQSPLIATADFAYIRFHGSTALYSSCYTENELSDWARKLLDLSTGLKKVYIYFNNDADGFALINAATLRNKLESST